MDEALRQALLELDCAALADADRSIRVLDAALRPVNAAVKMVGSACTVRCRDDFLSVIEALATARPGDVLVVDTQGSRRAVLGELFSLEARRRGLAGIIVDGAVRDIRTLRQLELPVYARSFCPVSGTVRDLGAVQVPVNCGGVIVNPGDIIVADDDGIVVGSAAELSAILPAARAIEAREALIRQRLAAGQDLTTMMNLSEHVAALRRGEPSQLAFRPDQ